MSLKVIKKWIPLVLIAALVFFLWAAGFNRQAGMEVFQAHKLELVRYVEQHQILAGLLFSFVYIMTVTLSLPVASFLTLLGGFLFGKWMGTFYVVFSATAGASIVFLLARSVFGKRLRAKAKGVHAKIQQNMKEHAFSYLLSIRLAPLFPFFLVNIAMAWFDISLKEFALATFLGIIPGSFVYANLGKALGSLESLDGLVSAKVIVAFSLLGILSLLPTLYRQVMGRKAVIASILIAGLLTVHPAMAGTPNYDRFLSGYAGLLSSYLQETQADNTRYMGVDYAGWQGDPRYGQVRKALLSVNPTSFSSDKGKMAFWINAYNFFTIDLVIRKGHGKSLKSLQWLFSSPWKKYTWALAGKPYSLDDIEDNILRSMGDARIHFAINCGSVSCPDLREEPYVPQKLDKQLDDQVQKTLANPQKGMHIAGHALYLTKIMDWFRKDFDDGDLKKWIRSFVPEAPIQSLDIQFMPYDWSLNKVKKSDDE